MDWHGVELIYYLQLDLLLAWVVEFGTALGLGYGISLWLYNCVLHWGRNGSSRGFGLGQGDVKWTPMENWARNDLRLTVTSSYMK